MVDVIVDSMGCPNYDCQACGTAAAFVRCYSCGPSSFYCESCVTEIQKNRLLHHFMEIWKVNLLIVLCTYKMHTVYVVIFEWLNFRKYGKIKVS